MSTANLSAEERHHEIWATRVQTELLALTTENTESTEASKAVLPLFLTVREHKLDLEKAICFVLFQVAVEVDATVKTVVVQLNASLPKNYNSSRQSGQPSYPFVAPCSTLLLGQEHFPPHSTIQNGDSISSDLEWTPSLHMADTMVNIGLKIKESLLQGEPFHPAPPTTQPFVDPVDEIMQSGKRLAAGVAQKAAGLGKHFHSPVGKKLSSKNKNKADKSKKSPRSVATSAEHIKIGDDINLLDEPWVNAAGVYACKAIRRPDFIVAAIEHANEKDEQQSFTTPSAMFRSFTKTARNALQESFLMITDKHVIEMKSSKLNPTTATITFCIGIELMHKLKFRRHESISLFFKHAPDDPLIYMCPDAGDAVHQIQTVLKQQHGVKGKHTNTAAHKAIADAMHLVQEIQTKEMALKHDPSTTRVNEIMDLYRQAAERFEVAGDVRHEEVVKHMRIFLALPLTVSILDGSCKKSEMNETKRGDGTVPQGEILERHPSQLDEDELDLTASTRKKKAVSSDKDFEENMDNLLKEAEADLEQFKLDGDASKDTDDISVESDGALAEVAADLDAMMKQADAELDELMNS
jgi:hypothetical protein